MAARFFAEAGGVAHVLEGQLRLLQPAPAVHGAQRLLGRGDQVLVVALACHLAQPQPGSANYQSMHSVKLLGAIGGAQLQASTSFYLLSIMASLAVTSLGAHILPACSSLPPKHDMCLDDSMVGALT